MKAFMVTNNKAHSLELSTKKLEKESSTDCKIKVEYSCVNYKDALALTGKGKILRKFPLVPGIDAAGTIIESYCSSFKEGDKILVNGSGFGETRNGGFSQELFSPEDLMIPLPKNMTTKQAMLLGTAGFTAALAIYQMELNGQTPEKGPILVSGASGGVGGLACLLLKEKQYEVHALTGTKEKILYLESLGVDQVLLNDELNLGERALESARYAGVIDNLGGSFLSKVLAHVDLFGNVACIGLAESPTLNASVMPFILRGVNLLGVSSANTPMDLRRKIWAQLGSFDLDKILSKLNYEVCDWSNLLEKAEELLDRKVQGRLLFKLAD